MVKKDDRKQPAHQTPASPHNPLADLLREKGFAETAAPAAPGISPAPAMKPDEVGTILARAGKLVLRREKKGHGGKTVTVLSGLDVRTAEVGTTGQSTAQGTGLRLDDRRENYCAARGHPAARGDLALCSWGDEGGVRELMGLG